MGYCAFGVHDRNLRDLGYSPSERTITSGAAPLGESLTYRERGGRDRDRWRGEGCNTGYT